MAKLMNQSANKPLANTTTEPAPPAISLTMDMATIQAGGMACEAIGIAIAALARAGMKEDAAMLANELKHIASNVSWIIRAIGRQKNPWIDKEAD